MASITVIAGGAESHRAVTATAKFPTSNRLHGDGIGASILFEYSRMAIGAGQYLSMHYMGKHGFVFWTILGDKFHYDILGLQIFVLVCQAGLRLDHFVVEAAASGNIGSQTAGVSFPIGIEARDASNNIATGFAGGGQPGGIVLSVQPKSNATTMICTIINKIFFMFISSLYL